MELINGVEVYFNMADVDFYEKYMRNAEEMDRAMSYQLTEEDSADYKNVVSLFRERCSAVKTFLDKVCGEGTGDKVCGNVPDIVICSKVYESIIEIANRQTNAMTKKLEDVFGRINSDANKE